MDNVKDRERRDDRLRHRDKDVANGKDKHVRCEDGNDSGDRYRKHSRHEENEYHADRKRNYYHYVEVYSSQRSTREEDERKLKSSEVEQGHIDEDTLQLPEQEEEDINRIKEESRKRREAIMEKYKKQHQQIEQAAGNEGNFIHTRMWIVLLTFLKQLMVRMMLLMTWNNHLLSGNLHRKMWILAQRMYLVLGAWARVLQRVRGQLTSFVMIYLVRHQLEFENRVVHCIQNSERACCFLEQISGSGELKR